MANRLSDYLFLLRKQSSCGGIRHGRPRKQRSGNARCPAVRGGASIDEVRRYSLGCCKTKSRLAVDSKKLRVPRMVAYGSTRSVNARPCRGCDRREAGARDGRAQGLVQAGFEVSSRPKWTTHGSTRWLWKEENVRSAIDYVLNGQGEDMEVYRGPEPWS